MKRIQKLAFGPESSEASAGSLGFSDARLLLFPVKSVKNVFGWITCPQVITRFKRDLELCRFKELFEIPKENTAPNGCGLFVKDDKIVFEEYTFSVQEDKQKEKKAASQFALWIQTQVAKNAESFWKEKIGRDIVIISDEEFRDFVKMSTEVIARTRIDDHTGTVAKGALWYEEYLPSDSILYSIVFSGPVYKEKNEEKGEFRAEAFGDKKKTWCEAEKVMAFFNENLSPVLQIGGNATIGKGFVRTVFLDGKEKTND